MCELKHNVEMLHRRISAGKGVFQLIAAVLLRVKGSPQNNI